MKKQKVQDLLDYVQKEINAVRGIVTHTQDRKEKDFLLGKLTAYRSIAKMIITETLDSLDLRPANIK